MKDAANENLQNAYDYTYSCVQCGYCLPACPTYKTMKKETHSPRGRINLVKMAAEGKITLDEISGPIELCLGCRACERVCPTNVQYGKMLESAKAAIQKERKAKMSPFRKFAQDVIFKNVFPNEKVMDAIGNLLWVYQKSGIKKIIHSKPFDYMFPKNLTLFDKGLTEAKTPFKTSRVYKSEVKHHQPIFKIAFFTGCIMEAIFQRINQLSIKLLEQAGCEVTVVKNQTCCGALHAHSGEEKIAKTLAKQNIEAFEKGEFDYVVNNAGGCGAMLKEYVDLFRDEPDWMKRAEKFSEKSVDISVVLSQLHLPLVKSVESRVTYQPSCHMMNVQKVTKAPVKLILSVKGIEYIPLSNHEFCCGSAGIYNVVHFQESMDILDIKMADVKETRADLIVTTNPGCLLQMKAGIEKEGLSGQMKALHLVELLAEACGIED